MSLKRYGEDYNKMQKVKKIRCKPSDLPVDVLLAFLIVCLLLACSCCA